MSNKTYQVLIQDEWNNLTLMGFYHKLENAIPDINKWLEVYPELKPLDELKEYPSTFDWCFDREIEPISEEDDYATIMVRGFVLPDIKDIKYEDEEDNVRE